MGRSRTLGSFNQSSGENEHGEIVTISKEAYTDADS